MIELPVPYPHQADMISRLRSSLVKNQAAILCASPGVGKTLMAKYVIASKLQRPVGEGETGRALFTVHRRGLVENASGEFSTAPVLPHGIIMSGAETAWKNRAFVSSIDTMVAWYVEGEYKSEFTYDLVVFDECHSHHGKLAKWFAAHGEKRRQLGLKPAYLIGLSATPQAKGLADLYKEIVKGPPKSWLIQNWFLVPFKYIGATKGQLGKLVRQGKEFTNASVDEAMQGLDGDFARDWFKHGEGRPTVGFFNRIEQSKNARDLLLAQGVNAVHVDGDTKDDIRNAWYAQLATGDIQYICNVGIIERGTNIPAISCVQLCTAIGSRVRYEQMIGRGSRPCSGKVLTVVIDHGGNVLRHGFFEDEIDWTLDVERDPVDEFTPKPTVECPQCGVTYRGGKCRSCGYEPTPKEREKQGCEWNGVELVELKPAEKKPKIKTCEQIMIDSLYRAGRSDKTWKQALGIAYREAEKQGTRFRVPRRVTIAGREYEMLPYGHPDSNRRVKYIFDFV